MSVRRQRPDPVFLEPRRFGPAVHEVLPVAHAQQHRQVTQAAPDRLQHAQAVAVGAVHVLDHDHQRPRRGLLPHQPQEGLADARTALAGRQCQPGRTQCREIEQVGCRVRVTLARRPPGGHGGAAPLAFAFGVDVGLQAHQRAHEVGQGAVGQMAGVRARRHRTHPEAETTRLGGELRHDARLADAGVAAQTHHGHAAACHPQRHVTQRCERALASDQGRQVAALRQWRGCRALAVEHEQVQIHFGVEAADLARPQRMGVQRTVQQARRRLAQHHAPGCRHFLEPRGQVDRRPVQPRVG